MYTPEHSLSIRDKSRNGTNLWYRPQPRIEREDDAVFIYERGGKRRYRIHQLLPGNKPLRSVELDGMVSGGFWYTLMGVYHNSHTMNRGEELSIVVGAIDVSLPSFVPMVSGIRIIYSFQEDGIGKRGAQFRYRGNTETIAAELLQLQALRLTTQDFPQRIDVSATAQQFVGAFFKGQFRPPQLVLPNL